ncbi:MAG: pilus assembly protein N-terminal domain-containing protein [Alphaproteobacteria bacterium]
MKRSITKILASLAVCLAVVSLSVMAQGASSGNTVKLSIGKADTINLSKPAADVLVASPGVADVGSLRSNRLYVVGKAIGDTNVLVFDEEGNQIADISIQVRADQQTLRETVREFFPNEAIDVRTVNDSVVLQGDVSTPATANQVRDLVGRFVRSGQSIVDLMKVQGEQQVMLKVKVIEAKRSLLREYGVQTNVAGFSNGKLDGSFTSTAGGVGLAAVSEFGSGTLALAQMGGFGPLTVNYQALENKGLVNTLAEPTLTAISGETAGFLAGGEFPVPASRDSSGNITVEFKQFGVALNFIPTVLSSDRISMQLTSEVSEKSDVDGVTFGGITVPGLAIRRAQTTVQIGSGGTLMIAGLLKSSATDALNGYPGLSSIPILGNLFKSKSFQRGESELVFLVTPYIVKPYGMQQGERVAAASPLPSEIVTTSHAVSLTDARGHTALGRPATSVIPTAVPSATPAGVAMPVPAVNSAPLAPLPVRRSDASPSQPETRFAEVQQPVKVIWDAPVAAPVKRVAVKATAPVQKAVVAPVVKQAAVVKAPAAPGAATKPAPAALKETEKTAMPAKPVIKAALTPSSPAPKPQVAAVRKAPVPVKPVIAARSDKPAAPAPKAVVAAKSALAPKGKVAVKTAAKAGQNPLSASYMNNLRSVYGNKLPSTMTSGAGVGYIVD